MAPAAGPEVPCGGHSKDRPNMGTRPRLHAPPTPGPLPRPSSMLWSRRLSPQPTPGTRPESPSPAHPGVPCPPGRHAMCAIGSSSYASRQQGSAALGQEWPHAGLKRRPCGNCSYARAATGPCAEARASYLDADRTWQVLGKNLTPQSPISCFCPDSSTSGRFPIDFGQSRAMFEPPTAMERFLQDD